MNTPLSPVSGRLASLDILRGFDLFLLVFFQPVFVALGQRLNLPWLNDILYQFDHESWIGFRFWDLVMPLFLFMTGASMPFSFAKFREEPNKGPVYRKIFRRFIILFIFGMIVQGNLLGLNPKYLYLYSNTLQAIATGYLIAAFILLHCSFKYQILITLLLLVVYWIPMTFWGDYTPVGNFAEKVDRLVLGRFRDGVYWGEDGDWHFSPGYTYTWIWSSLTFGVTVMLGTFAGKIMKEGKENRKRVVQHLLLLGIALIGISLLWSLQMPIIKRLWTCSMTLFSGGLCFLLMGLFYYWIDYKGHTNGLNWLKIYGMNSITAYILGEVVNFRCVAASVSYGLEQYLGSYYTVWLSFVNYLIVFLILRIMYKHRVFLKI
ncbi:acyltransferase family protein [Bacteroides congonensis]|uniref:acyltransferase family protein n=1 Tax=Bacteroides congonensis TaxID=1871006 RepID=UPI003A8565ED